MTGTVFGGFTEILWQRQATLPLLLLLQVLPLLGAALIFAFKERTTAVVLGKAFALGELLLAIVAVVHLDPTLPALQLAERFAPLAYHVAVDGLSMVFILSAALLTFLMTLYGMSRGMISPGRLFAVLLIAEAGLVGFQDGGEPVPHEGVQAVASGVAGGVDACPKRRRAGVDGACAAREPCGVARRHGDSEVARDLLDDLPRDGEGDNRRAAFELWAPGRAVASGA